ncbi:MAG: hypothetical protein QM813_26360 [Verrucomicrobiota bacterium]
MTAADHKLDEIYLRLGGRNARSYTLAQVRDAAIRSEYEATGYMRNRAAENLGIARTTMFTWLAAQRAAARAAIACWLICLSPAFAQSKGAALLIPTLPVGAVMTNKQAMLTWESNAYQFAVRTGTNRSSVGNRQVVATNAVPFERGLVYDVRALNAAGIEGAPAYYPSNRVGSYWLRGYGANLAQGTNIARLVTFTNIPPGNMQFWGIADVTEGWLPPD